MTEAILLKLKHLEEIGLYPYYVPEFHIKTGAFMGYTPCLCVQVGEEFSGGLPAETREEAIGQAIRLAEDLESEIDQNKPLRLF